jgi:hypothetical protein
MELLMFDRIQDLWLLYHIKWWRFNMVSKPKVLWIPPPLLCGHVKKKKKKPKVLSLKIDSKNSPHTLIKYFTYWISLIKIEFKLSPRGSSIGWRSRLMKHESLVQILSPPLVWTCQKRKKKWSLNPHVRDSVK